MEPVRTLREILGQFDTAILITRSESGLRGRPMGLVEIEPSFQMWFLSEAQSGKVKEIEQDPEVLITLQRNKDCYVSISGHASIERNSAKIAELWKDPFEIWFPKGKSDPNLVLIRFEPEFGEYWDNRGMRRLEYSFERVKSLETGMPPRMDDEQHHGHVKFH